MKPVCLVVQNIYDIDPRVRRKAEALVEAGYSVDVLALRAEGGEKSYTIKGVNVRTISLGKQRGSLLRYVFEYASFFLWVMARLPLQMLRRRYAVVDVNTLPDFLIFAALPARWLGAKLVLDMHEITPEFYMSKYRVAADSAIIRLMKVLERISMDAADHVLTVNDPIEDLLVERGLDRRKSTVMMNAANEARFTNYLQGADPTGNPERFVMIYHGTLTPIYGLDIAVEAFALACKEMPGSEFWILGRGSEEQNLERIARERGVSDRVKLIGQVASDRIAEWLNQSHVGVLPLRRDVFLDFAFPNKLGEFIVMNKPVIISGLKAIRHYFTEEALAYFEPNSAADLAEKMIAVYRDPDLRGRLTANAKIQYAPIRWELMKQRYLNLIQQMSAATKPAVSREPIGQVNE
jgi:glycosyltransferase involved in cell wall biosynthesis